VQFVESAEDVALGLCRGKAARRCIVHLPALLRSGRSGTLRLGLLSLSDQPETALGAVGDSAGSTIGAVADTVFSADRDAWTHSTS